MVVLPWALILEDLKDLEVRGVHCSGISIHQQYLCNQGLRVLANVQAVMQYGICSEAVDTTERRQRLRLE